MGIFYYYKKLGVDNHSCGLWFRYTSKTCTLHDLLKFKDVILNIEVGY